MIKWDCGNRTQVAVQAILRRAAQPGGTAEFLGQLPVAQLPDEGPVSRVS
jgi:hypothetical protein